VIENDSSHVQRNKSGELWSTIHEVGHVLKLGAEDTLAIV